MNSQTKAIIGAVVVLMLALAAVSGVTYSWWSDSESGEITVTTGTLDVSTSEYKLTDSADSSVNLSTTDGKVPSAIALYYGETGDNSASAYYIPQTSNPDKLGITITYNVEFTASVGYTYMMGVSFPDGVTGTASAVVPNGTTNSNTSVSGINDLTTTVSQSGEASVSSKLSDTYTVTISITKVSPNLSGAAIVFTNYITQKSNENASSEAFTLSNGSYTSTSETSSAGYISVAGLPATATTLKATVTTDDSRSSASIDLSASDASGTVAVKNSSVQVSVTLSGYYDSLVFNGTGDQPTGVSYIYYEGSTSIGTKDSGATSVTWSSGKAASDVYTTSISFTTTHFSEFIAYDASVVSYVYGVDTLKTALAGSGDIILASDINGDLASLLTIEKDKEVAIDLNNHMLTSTSVAGAHITGVLTITNGSLYMSAENGADGNRNSGACSLWVYEGGTLVLDHVSFEAKATAVGAVQKATSVRISDSEIIAHGCYAVATNSATEDNYGVSISIADSIITMDRDFNNNNQDECAVCFNVAGTLDISGSTITADRQCLLVRAGTATVSNTKLVYNGAYTNTSYVGNGGTTQWGSGDEVASGAIVLGDYGTKWQSSYNADAILTLDGCTVEVSNDAGNKSTLVMAQDGSNYTTILKLGGTNTGVLSSAAMYDHLGNKSDISNSTTTSFEITKDSSFASSEDSSSSSTGA